MMNDGIHIRIIDATKSYCGIETHGLFCYPNIDNAVFSLQDERPIYKPCEECVRVIVDTLNRYSEEKLWQSTLGDLLKLEEQLNVRYYRTF